MHTHTHDSGGEIEKNCHYNFVVSLLLIVSVKLRLYN